LKGRAFCCGAATIINGIATGFGAAFGIGLTIEAEVELTGEPRRFDVRIEGDEKENPDLATYCVSEVLKRYGLEKEYGARIRTRSDIPISRGLSSSSAASNAIVLSAFRAIEKEYTDTEIIDMGINASIAAQVTLTGAFDDACAAYFGNVVVTDNLKRAILARYDIEEDFLVLIHVPDEKIRKTDLDTGKLKNIAKALTEAHGLAQKGDFLTALRINGYAYSEAMGLDSEIARRAMEAGAATAGISGTGPATVILVHEENKDEVISAVGDEDRIICTHVNKKKAGAL
jgi:shikimate kinase